MFVPFTIVLPVLPEPVCPTRVCLAVCLSGWLSVCVSVCPSALSEPVLALPEPVMALPEPVLALPIASTSLQQGRILCSSFIDQVRGLKHPSITVHNAQSS